MIVRVFTTFILTLLTPVLLLAGPLAVFNHKIFYTPEGEPLVETYFDFSARSLTFVPGEDGLVTAKVELTIIFKKYGDIVAFDKKVITSPKMEAHERIDFIDMHRFMLEPGRYEVEIVLRDVLAQIDDESNLITALTVPAPKKGAHFSDIQLISALRKADSTSTVTKAGYDMLPMVSDSLLKSGMKEIIFYAELYGMPDRVDDEMFLLKRYIRNTNNQEVVESTVKMSRETVMPVKPILVMVDIADLPQGNYEITLEARDTKNELLARATHGVHRVKLDSRALASVIHDPSSHWVGQYDNQAELYDYVNSIRPIATTDEANILDVYFVDAQNSELPHLQRFFYAFWEAREPGFGLRAWEEYKKRVDFVNEEFSTRNKRGYDTDMGRIYLKYGAPNHIADRSSEPGSYPYQIWQYYKTGQFNNARFVFYDPTLLNAEYQLLHSEGVRGEITNPRWRYILQIRSLPAENIDHKDGVDHFGGRADDLFENPR